MFALASCAAAKRDGKERLASGAWTISKDYIRNAGDCSDPSDPPSLRWSAGQCSYKLDRKLARCLATFFSGRSVTELGAGAGRYKAFVRAAGNVTAYAAYDGLPNAAELSGGLVETADLSVDQPSLRRSDWAMSLEVFEHIPRRFEDAVRRNVDRAAGDGVVISWSVMGGSQSEHGHVNPKRKTQGTPRAAAASALCVPRRPARPVPKLTSLASGRGSSPISRADRHGRGSHRQCVAAKMHHLPVLTAGRPGVPAEHDARAARDSPRRHGHVGYGRLHGHFFYARSS